MARKEKITFSKFDLAEGLKTEEDIAACLEAIFEEASDDAGVIALALGHVARARGMTRLAKHTGLARESLYQALSGRGNPSLGMLLKVMKALGLRLSAKAA